MIITRKKPFEDVKKSLVGHRKVAIIGCGRCATTCQTGGEKEVSEMSALLEAEGFHIVYFGVVEAQCDERLAKLQLKKTQGADAILSMGCGSGASALSDLTNRPVINSNDTMFLGVVKRLGDYVERCGMCGNCTLTETMGICVKTRCAKGLITGPCGGSHKGKCEIGDGRECAWALVIERMRAARSLGKMSGKSAKRVG
jgi:ferredoxin